MIDNLFILGGHIQALGLARQAKRSGIGVFLFVPDIYSVARFSRSVDKIHICKTEGELLQLLEEQSCKNTMLFPTSDEYIDFIVRYYQLLNQAYTIALPDLSSVKLFADKTSTYRFAEDNGIPHPWCRYPQNVSEVYSLADDLEYPVVIKPAVMYDFHNKFGKKAFLCESKNAFLTKVNELSITGYPINALIIQEFLAGGARNLYSFGFFAVDGVVKSSVMVNRIRQNPMDFGNSTTFAVTVDIPEIESVSRRILKLTNYTGMGEIEFMYDKGQYKFLEINTRAWKWHTITNGLGFSFIEDWIGWINNGFLQQRETDQKQCAWVERLTDIAVIVKGIAQGQVKPKEAFLSYFQKKVSAVWSIYDPLPAVMYVLMSPILFIKRY